MKTILERIEEADSKENQEIIEKKEVRKEETN